MVDGDLELWCWFGWVEVDEWCLGLWWEAVGFVVPLESIVVAYVTMWNGYVHECGKLRGMLRWKWRWVGVACEGVWDVLPSDVSVGNLAASRML